MSWVLQLHRHTGALDERRECESGDSAKAWAKRNQARAASLTGGYIAQIVDPVGQPWKWARMGAMFPERLVWHDGLFPHFPLEIRND